jgi:hypothetical protein
MTQQAQGGATDPATKASRIPLIIAATMGGLLLVSVSGYVLINLTARPTPCQDHQKQVFTQLSAMTAVPVAGATLTSAPDTVCDAYADSVSSSFNGPIAKTALIAAYRQRAVEDKWREGDPGSAYLLCFEGSLPDGTPYVTHVWTDSSTDNGVVPDFYVDAGFATATTTAAPKCVG